MSLCVASLHCDKAVSAGLCSGKIPLWRAHWAAAREQLGLTHANASVIHSCEARGVTQRAPNMTQSINQSVNQSISTLKTFPTLNTTLPPQHHESTTAKPRL